MPLSAASRLAAAVSAPVLAGAGVGRLHSMANDPTGEGIEGIQQETIDSELNRQNSRLDRLIEIEQKRKERESRRKKSRSLRLA